MSLLRFKVMTFDVVGTLIDFERGMVEYFRSILPADTMPADDAIFDAYKRSRAAPGAGWYPDDLVRVYGDMARELRLPPVAGGGEGYRDSVNRWPAFPDSAAALKRLKSRFRLVAMTNARNWALAHMLRTLGDPFDDTITVDDVGVEKPDPQFFAFARGRLSAAGHGLADILHVAQSQYHDVGVARKLGFTVCWIERRRGLKGFGASKDPAAVTKPDHHFATLAELADAVDAAAAVP